MSHADAFLQAILAASDRLKRRGDALDLFERQESAARILAVLLYGLPWYHRTTMLDLSALAVYGEGERPDWLPGEFAGYPIEYRRVTKEHPCPFGSVKPHPREGMGNKV